MILRARLQFLSAIAAGLAACHPDTPPADVTIPPGVPASASAEPSATAVAPVATSAPTIATSVAPSVTSAPPLPSVTGSVVAANPPPSRLGHCPSAEKLQHPCFAVKSIPSTGGNAVRQTTYDGWDKNGCFQPNEIVGACNGISLATGPFFRGGQCCFDVCQGAVAPCGRPFVVQGHARVADVVTRTDWIASPLALDDAIGRLRSQAATAWRDDAAQEHASIASFARLSLELLAHGAPPTLIAAAHQAALDEIDHARVCYAIATELSGAAVALGPAPLSLEGLSLDCDLASLAVRAATEGCVGETIAALALSRAAASCESPALAARLSKMADDELTHAALAWQCVAWAWGRIGARDRDAVVRALTVGEVDAPFVSASDAPGWWRLGRLTREDMREVVAAARALVDEAKTQLTLRTS